jgi:anti-sigma factor RsiW
MNVDLGIKLQAYLDGELAGSDARAVASLIETDAAARDLFAELQQTRSLLRANEPEFHLPESREFFWSKIEREISRPEAAVPSEAFSWFAFLRRHLGAATGACVALALALFVAFQMNWVSPDIFEEIENPLEETGSFSFRSESQQMTLVWISNPSASSEETDDSMEEF